MDYYIKTPEDLSDVLRKNIEENNTKGNCFILLNDLDCSRIEHFVPLGSGSNHAFDGELDGKGHVIRNLTISPPQTYNLGFFSMIGTGTVKNLRFESIAVRQNLNALEKNAPETQAGIIAAVCRGTISECCAQGSVTVQAAACACHVGGLCGSLPYAASAIRNSWADVDISFQETEAQNAPVGSNTSYSVGGIAGSANGILDSCHSNGEIFGPPARFAGCSAGGICGKADSCINVTACYSLAYLHSRGRKGDSLGGIAGTALKEEAFSNCFYLKGCILSKAPGDTANDTNRIGTETGWKDFIGSSAEPGTVLAALGSGYAYTLPDGCQYAPHLTPFEEKAGVVSSACYQKALSTPAVLSFGQSVYPGTKNPVEVICKVSNGSLKQASITAVRPDQSEDTLIPEITGNSFRYDLGNNQYILYHFVVTVKDKYNRTLTVSDEEIEIKP